jgi:hypothetical protein
VTLSDLSELEREAADVELEVRRRARKNVSPDSSFEAELLKMSAYVWALRRSIDRAKLHQSA